MRTAVVLLALLAAAGADTRAATIAVDVGHHARSPGATSARGLPEFGYNRALALRLGAELDTLGHRVVAVGIEGDAAELAARPRAARGAALFVSIHHDSVQPHLMETWTFEGETLRYSDRHAGYSLFVSRRNRALASSLRCASAIGAALRAAGFTPSRYHADPVEGENRPFADETNGVHYFDDLVVLRTAKMPALLLEAGVIVNRAEELLLRDPDRQQRMAAAVARGADGCVRGGTRRAPRPASPTR